MNDVNSHPTPMQGMITPDNLYMTTLGIAGMGAADCSRVIIIPFTLIICNDVTITTYGSKTIGIYNQEPYRRC